MTQLYQLISLFPAQVETTQPDGMKAFLLNIAPFLMMAAAFYFLMLRPMWKQNKAHQTLLKSLKKEDEVLTNSGMRAKIHSLGDQIVVLEIAPGVRIQQLRSTIQGKWVSSVEQKEEITGSEAKT